jgi:hypothetical protein
MPVPPKEASERNALKEAILKAQHERQEQKKAPVPVVPPPKAPASPGEAVSKEVFDDVDPVLLRRLLHDDI